MTDLTRLTVNLTQKSAEAMEHAAELNRDTKTDTVNRALQVYDYICTKQAEGFPVLVGELNIIVL